MTKKADTNMIDYVEKVGRRYCAVTLPKNRKCGVGYGMSRVEAVEEALKRKLEVDAGDVIRVNILKKGGA